MFADVCICVFFHQTLQQVATTLYNDIVVVTVYVDQYTAWSGQFVPRNYAADVHGKLIKYSVKVGICGVRQTLEGTQCG